MYCRTEPPHPRRSAKGLYPLHRVLMENKIGTSLGYNDLVHHKDGNKSNDSPENLELVSRSEHTRLHILRGDVLRNRCVLGAGK